MKYIRTMATAAATLSVVAFAASRASAGDLLVSSVVLAPPYGTEFLNVFDPDRPGGTGPGFVTAAAGAIGLNIVGRTQPLWVFCVDLNHDIVLTTYDPPLPYKIAPVNTDSTGTDSGTGNTLSKTQSEEIATLAAMGVADVTTNPSDGQVLAEIQGAIWQIEYGGVVSASSGSYDPTTINMDIANDVLFAIANPSSNYDAGLYPDGSGGQGFGTTQGFATGGIIPEPASWAIMIVGIGGVGGVVRSRRRSVMATTTA